MRAEVGKVDGVAHRFDFDHFQFARGGFAVGGGLIVVGAQQAKIRVGVLGKPVAGFALAAGALVGARVFAQQRLRHMAGKHVLADAGGAGKQ